ncbi:MAG: efflux RND transporter periplasmic adaptor subunit [Kofleriaceae bacterium]
MKRILMGLLIILASIPILGSFFYLYKKSQTKPVVFKTETAQTLDIRKKTVATGSVVPRQSVDIKPKITGILTSVDVEPGKFVKKGDQLGKVEIIPEAGTVNSAESNVRTAQITAANAKRELDREEGLFKQGVVPEAELYKFRTDYALAKAQAETAASNLQIVKEGQTRGQKGSTLVVTAAVEGMVIDVPVKVGYSVIQANSFNPGTTIATIANMGDMIFDGHVDESEVAKIKEGMKLQIKVGAIDKDTFEGKLEYIAPQGKEIDGAIQFEIKAAIVQKKEQYIRAGYSANADIVLDEKPKVLAIREALVQYDKDKPFVEVETTPQTFTKKDVKLGLSDGINVEVLSGVTLIDKIKIPENAGPDKPDMPPGQGSGKGSGKAPAKK